MRSIRTKYTLLTVCAIVVALCIATSIAVASIKKLGNDDADQMLSLMCATGAMNLDSYFESVEQSVGIVSSFAEQDLDGLGDEELASHVRRTETVYGVPSIKVDEDATVGRLTVRDCRQESTLGAPIKFLDIAGKVGERIVENNEVISR